SNDIRIYGYQIFAAECDDEQDDGFGNRWKNINKIFSDPGIDFHHKIGKKSTQKKEKYIQCDMKSGLKFLLESCSHEKSKMSCHISGKFLNGQKSYDIHQSGNESEQGSDTKIMLFGSGFSLMIEHYAPFLLANCPHAASISPPLLRRTNTLIPAFSNSRTYF